MTARKRKYTKIALALSAGLLILWLLLGATTSLAWFTDTTPTQKNVFNIGTLDLKVSYRMEDGNYKEIDGETAIFDESALYEPGYVQVVYLKVKNTGEIPFDYRTALIVNNYTTATNWYGGSFSLPDHLRYGIVSAETEAKLEALIGKRPQAVGQAGLNLKEIADRPLNQYTTDQDSLKKGEERYIALIVRMPEEVGNVANYRGTKIPEVDLGLSVSATQQGTPID